MNEDMVVNMDECTEIANTLQRKTSADAGSATVAAALLMQVDGDRKARDVAVEAMDESKATFIGALKALGLDSDVKLDDLKASAEADQGDDLPVCELPSDASALAKKKGTRLKVMLNHVPVVAMPNVAVVYAAHNLDANDFRCIGGRTISDNGEVSEKTPAILPDAEKPLAVGQHELAGTEPGPDARGHELQGTDAAGQGSQE